MSLHSDLMSGRLTSVHLVEKCLSRISKYDGYLHAVISSAPKQIALSRAKELDSELLNGKVRGVFHGIPILVKVG